MAIDMFMKVEGVNGESKDSNHKDWTNIESFDWGAGATRFDDQRWWRWCR